MFKRLILSSTLLLAVNLGYSQIFNKGFSAGLNVGVTQPFADTYDSDLTINFGLGVQYHLTSYTFVSADFVKSTLERENLDRYYRRYRNSFTDLTLTANMSLGQVLAPMIGPKLFINNIYIGAGVGVINSNVTQPNSETTDQYGGKRYKGSDLIIPINLGYDFKLAKKGKIVGNVNYQYDYSTSDALDGYDVPFSKSSDVYYKVTVGIKYLFGKPGGSNNSLDCYY
ncbi:MAG: hypothetical protein JWN56_465 [Sphingobacteriales bacterium]|nr:hypothetical protein [Sphingobacteriales bacterium]